ncbi:heme o synthase [Paenactinomyces guangxiensis]|uniref:Protoheme IX farnesyltransferase n=1 Tax=Paenactinomyces guangxiensis TaxID=1490290 RepID=A0A7W2A9N5_9BACL|nr:heme o synthase [Paenactinomyces guangxiensis]MBA4495454.1 protoheme IX farnesyltransferase [Paenactinomyces guangxiensis]MBH8592423.1 protoheme IX farnesyltransferase [Paenactinomyces guangxiensis]
MVDRSVSQQTAADQNIAIESFTGENKTTWRDYIEITKPGINKSNLFATFAGYWLATGFTSFDFVTLLFAMLGSGLTIAGSCTLNNFYDRDIDPLMERTRSRPVPDGRIKPSVALWYGIFLTTLGIIVLTAGVNPLSAFLGFIGFFVYVFIYTMWLKRTSTLNTVIGGICGSVPPMIGWVAGTGSLDLTAWALFLILFMWQPPHFFALAMMKADDYRAAGIPMLPIVKGFKETKKQTLIFTLLLLPSSYLLFYTGAVGWFYLVIALILGGVYIALAIKGFNTKEDDRWARQMFFYSLIYLTVILLAMIIDVAITEALQF